MTRRAPCPRARCVPRPARSAPRRRAPASTCRCRIRRPARRSRLSPMSRRDVAKRREGVPPAPYTTLTLLDRQQRVAYSGGARSIRRRRARRPARTISGQRQQATSRLGPAGVQRLPLVEAALGSAKSQRGANGQPGGSSCRCSRPRNGRAGRPDRSSMRGIEPIRPRV